MSDDNSASRVPFTRREYLASAVGIGALSLGGAGSASGQSGGTVEIPTRKRGDEVVETETVPADWAQHFEHAREALFDRKKTLLGAEGVSEVSLQSSPEQSYGGKPGFQIKAGVGGGTPTRAVDLPDHVEDIPVNVESAPDGEPLSCPGRGDFSTIRGGSVAIYNDGVGRGSPTTSVDLGNQEYLMTAAHVAETSTCDPDIGSSMYLDGGSVEFGEVDFYDSSLDIALIRNTSSSHDFYNGLRLEWTDSSTVMRIDVGGYVTEAGIANEISNSESVAATGSTTGYTTGDLTEMYLDASETSSNCIDFGGHGVRSEAGAAQGDSGGAMHGDAGSPVPIYSVVQYGWSYVGDHDCGGSEYQQTGGTAGYHINDEYGIEFDV